MIQYTLIWSLALSGAGNWEANSETAFKYSIPNGIRKEVVFYFMKVLPSDQF